MTKKDKPFMNTNLTDEGFKEKTEEIGVKKMEESLEAKAKGEVPTVISQPKPMPKEDKAVVNENTAVISEFQQRYLAAVEGTNIEFTAKAFANMIRQAVVDPSDANMEFLFTFFSNEKYKNKILHESVVFKGAPSLSYRERTQVETMYTLFRELTTTNRKLNLEYATELVGEKVVNWFIRRQKSIPR